VRKSGILIGRVTHVELDDGRGGVMVTVKINSDIHLRRDEVARITSSLLGDAVIQFVPGDSTQPTRAIESAPRPPGGDLQSGDDQGVAFVLCAYQAGGNQPPPVAPPRDDEFIEPGSTIEGTVQTNPLQVISDLQGDFSQAISAITTAGNEVTKLAQNLNQALGSNDEQINRIVRKTEESLDAFQGALKNINSVIGDPKVRADLTRSIEELPELLKQSRGAVTGIQKPAGRARRRDRGSHRPDHWPNGRSIERIGDLWRSAKRATGYYRRVAQEPRTVSASEPCGTEYRADHVSVEANRARRTCLLG
jgi:phospholipid/cholesterol/gamma-HCH transport system substrate-binding protein